MLRLARRYQILAASVVLGAWLAALAGSVVAIVRGVQTGATTQLSAQQVSLAVEAARGIEDYFDSLTKGLLLLAGDDHVVAFDSAGPGELQRYFALNADELQSVTRMSAAGTIMFTFPNVSSTGTSIAAQTHVQRLLATHEPVLSEVFTSVQGYRSLALHVPVFENDVFDGSVAVLIPFDSVSQHYLAKLPIGNAGYAWVLSRSGVELFGPIAGFIGRSLGQTRDVSPGEMAMARDMMQGRSGTATFASDHVAGQPRSVHAVYMPIRLIDTYWSIAMEAPDNDILALMRSFLTTWIPTIALLVMGIAGALLLLFFNMVSRREQRSKAIAEARYQSLVEQLPAINYVVEINGAKGNTTTYISPQVRSILGFTPEEWIADRDLWFRQIHPEDRDMVRALIRQGDAEGLPRDLEYRAFTKAGEMRWLHNRGSYVRDSAGRPTSMTGVIIDITEKQRAQDALRESEESYRTLITTTPLAVIVSDMNGTIVICNLQAVALAGASRDEDLLGGNIFDRVLPQDKERAQADMRRAQETGGIRNLRYALRRQDGSTIEAELNGSLVLDKAGAPRYVMLVVQDITDRISAEHALRDRDEKLQQALKLEAVGRLAGGVAHDFNNLLTVIRGYADTLMTTPGLPVMVRKDLEEILAASLRAQSLTDQLLAYSRKQMRSPQIIDINARVRHMEGMLRRLIGEHITLRVVLDPALATVRADPDQIEQIIMNLAVNARDSMPDGGTLTLVTRNRVLAQPEIARPLVPAGRYVVFSMEDSGVGMSDQTLTHIFEPFYTTKEMGKGTGLGLSTVYGIVKQSGGFIFVDSAPGQGARFEIYLPQAAGEPETAPVATHAHAPAKSSGRILVAEDEDTVRLLTRTILTRSGYTVLEARNGQEALAACVGLGGDIDLLVTDVIMPVMGGIELGRRIGALYPRIRILYMSGYTDDEPGLHVVAEKGSPILRKPFNAVELNDKVKDVLAEDLVGPQGLEPWTNGL